MCDGKRRKNRVNESQGGADLMESRMGVISRQWHEGKARRLQGDSPHDRPVSRGILSLKENLRRSLRCHWLPALTEILKRLSIRFFKAWRSRSDVVQTKTKPYGGNRLPPARRPRAQVNASGGPRSSHRPR